MNFSSNLHNFHGETNVGLDYFNSDCSSIMIRFHLLRMVGRWRPILAVQFTQSKHTLRRLEIYIFRAVRVFNWVGGGGEKEEKELKPPSWAPERRWSLSI